jgi:hypothetical protein
VPEADTSLREVKLHARVHCSQCMLEAVCGSGCNSLFLAIRCPQTGIHSCRASWIYPWDDQHVLYIVSEAACSHPVHCWPQEGVEWLSLMVLCARLLIAVVCAVLTAASVVEGIAYASAVLKRVYLYDDWNLMMWVAFHSLRNAFRGSLEQIPVRGRATERRRGATRLHAPTKLRILTCLSRE